MVLFAGKKISGDIKTILKLDNYCMILSFLMVHVSLLKDPTRRTSNYNLFNQYI